MSFASESTLGDGPLKTMSELVTFKVNDIEVSAPKGMLLIEAVKKAGVEIPHFCYHPRLKPDANCRMCLVEIEKMPKLQTACTMPVAEGMVVQTTSDSVVASQNGVMEYLLGNHPLDCPECDQGGECQLQDFGHQHSKLGSRFLEQKRVFPKEYFGPLVEKEMNRCVSCLRCVRYCDEVMGVTALGSFDRGNGTQIGTFAHGELDCEYCGGCIQICPVGALTSRLSMYENRTWQLKKTDTICNYCGDGCSLILEGVKDDITRVSSETGAGRNRGDLCARGFFGYGAINHKDRLSRPRLNTKGRTLEVTWDWAFNKAAEDLKKIVAQHGPDAVGGVISTHCSNEEAYLFQKLMREVIGTPHVDSTARYGYINALSALNEVFGTARLSHYEDIRSADVLLVVGADMAESNPIAGIQVKDAVRAGAQLITLDASSPERDTYYSHLPSLATQHLNIRFGTEQSAIIGLVKALFDKGIASSAPRKLVNQIKKKVAVISFAEIEATTGLTENSYRRAAQTYAGAEHAVMIVGRGVIQSEGGYQNMLRLEELSILAGQVGREGAGILPLASENNAFGVVESGASSEYLPGLKRQEAKPKALTLLEMIDAAAEGKLKALYLVGADPLRNLPQKKVADALSNLDLLICQDLFPTETNAHAHILLPAASFAEKSGHYTNHEGVVQKGHQAIEPVGGAKPDWMIFSILSNKIKEETTLPYFKLVGYRSADEVWKEAVMAMPNDWQQNSKEAISRHVAAYAEHAEIQYALQTPRASNGVMDLQLGQNRYHAGTTSRYAEGLNRLLDCECVVIHPDDAEALQLEEGERVRLSSHLSGASVELPIQLSQKQGRGALFVPEHFGLSVKGLLPLTIDRESKVPYGDRGPVKLSKVAASTQVKG